MDSWRASRIASILKTVNVGLYKISRKMMNDLNMNDMSQVIGKTDVDLFGEEFGRKTLENDLRLMAIR